MKLGLEKKINLTVEGNLPSIMYRYWIKENSRWTLLTDYSTENTFKLYSKTSRRNGILVECKTIQSENLFDDFRAIKFEVFPISSLEITNFKCVSTDLFSGQ